MEKNDLEMYWRDKRVTDMTREELIEALTTLGQLYNKALNRAPADMMRTAIGARRGAH